MGKISGGMNIVIGIVLISISLIMFPLVLDGAHTIISDANITDFTGLSSVVKVAPTLLFVVMLFGGGLFTISGIRKSRGGKGRKAAKRSV